MFLSSFRMPLALMACLSLLSGLQCRDSAIVEAEADNGTYPGCTWTRGESARHVSVSCQWRLLAADRVTVLPPRGDPPAGQVTALTVRCSERYHFRSQLGIASFPRLPQLQRLEIRSCQLSELPAAALTAVAGVRTLVVCSGNSRWGTQTLRIDQQAMNTLRHLRRLDLASNRLQLIGRNLFCNNAQLHHLHLAHNELSSCSAGLENCNNKLHHLNMDHNRLTSLSHVCFAKMRQLRLLQVSHNEISSIGSESLRGLKKLREVRADNNAITSIHEEAFLHTPELRVLDLNSNRLRGIPAVTLSTLKHLTYLNISHNQLGEGYDKQMRMIGAIRLTLLDISHNRISRLPYVDDLFSLQVFNLSYNMLERLEAEILAPLVNLDTLDVSHNLISHVPVLTLQALTTLKITNNMIASMSPDAFSGCPMLRRLHLTNNRLTSVPNAISQLEMLEQMDLSNNRLEGAGLGSAGRHASSTGLSNLKSLNLSQNQISSIRDTDLLPAWNLHQLDLSFNQIAAIAVGTFQKLTSLEELRLNENRLHQIGQLFMGVSSLRHLDLAGNKIVHFDLAMVPRDLLELSVANNNISVVGNHFSVEHRMKLQKLNIADNQLVELTSSTIPERLQRLILNKNHIRLVSTDAFLNKTKLSFIDLRGNEIASLSQFSLQNRTILLSENPIKCDCSMGWLLDSEVSIGDRHDITCDVLFGVTSNPQSLTTVTRSNFLCQYRTHCFALCHCCDFDACDCEMACPPGCNCFHDLLWNKNIVDCARRNHTQLPSTIPMDVTDVFLDGNIVPSLGTHQLIGRKYMRVLFLNNSHVESVHNKTFNGLSGLLTLHLQDNMITHLIGYEFVDLVALERLFLHDNRISIIDDMVFEPLKNLQELTMHGNRLTSLPSWPLLQNLALVSLTLSENPWSCECRFSKRLSGWMQSAEPVLRDLHQIQCLGDSGSRHLLVEEADRNCQLIASSIPTTSSDLFVPLMLLVFCTVGVMIAVSFLVVVFRHQLKPMLFSICGTRARLVSKSDIGADLYDVFISCSAKDLDAAAALVTELETAHPPYRCCLLGRDLPAHPQSIVQGATASRRCVLYVTASLLDGEWCRFDMKAAHTDPSFSGRRRLVLACDGAPLEMDIDAEMALLMQVHPVVHRDRHGGWSTLHRHLPGQRQRRRKPRWPGKTANPLARLARPGTHESLQAAFQDCSPDNGYHSASKTPTLSCINALTSEACPNPQHLYYTIDLKAERLRGVIPVNSTDGTSDRRVNSHTVQAFNRSNHFATSKTSVAHPSSDWNPHGNSSTRSLNRYHLDGRRHPGVGGEEVDVVEYTPAGWLFFSMKKANSAAGENGETYLV